MKILSFFLYLWVIFALLDPDPQLWSLLTLQEQFSFLFFAFNLNWFCCYMDKTLEHVCFFLRNLYSLPCIGSDLKNFLIRILRQNVKPTVTIVPFVKIFFIALWKGYYSFEGEKLKRKLWEEVSYKMFLVSIFSILKWNFNICIRIQQLRWIRYGYDIKPSKFRNFLHSISNVANIFFWTFFASWWNFFTFRHHLCRVSMLSFCDLAGSERISKTNNDGEREERWQSTS